MGFWQRIGYNFAGLARFSGRDDRQTFWSYVIPLYILLTVLVTSVTMIVLIQVFVQFFSQVDLTTTPPNDNPFAPSPLEDDMMALMRPYLGLMIATGAVSSLLHIILFAASMVRRLHDADRTGWWALLPIVAGTIGAMAGLAAFVSTGAGMQLLTTLISVIQLGAFGFMIYLLVQPGTPGPNRFGPPPT